MTNSIIGEISWLWNKSNNTVSALSYKLDNYIITPINDIAKTLKFDTISFSPNPDVIPIKARLIFWSGLDFFNVSSYVDNGKNIIQQQYALGQGYLRSNCGEKEVLPIIHVSAFCLQGENSLKVNFPRYSSIMDSSIWNSFFILDSKYYGDSTTAFQKQSDTFKEIIEKISRYYLENRYQLNVALEYADLSARITQSSFILPMDGSGHGFAVSPFLFHSENQMKSECENMIKKIKDVATDYIWRFLLVDDYASIPLKTKKEATPQPPMVSVPNKIQIISQNIKELGLKVEAKAFEYKNETFEENTIKGFEIKPNKSWGKVEIWSVPDTLSALSLLKKTEFDIVMLDYLLAEQRSQDQSHDYGYNLLNAIKNNCADAVDKIKYLRDNYSFMIGPHNKFFFMFISAFTTAVTERLNFEGLSRNSEIWEIGEGACPTNTPELFKYRLAYLMNRRLIQTGIASLTYENILKQLECIFHEDIVDETPKRSTHIKAVRQRAYNKYKDILGLHYDYFTLEEDKNKSCMVESFMNNRVNMDALLEHLLQFVHLVAFGTVRQWPEIWEEYKSVFRIFENAPKGDNDEKKKNMGKKLKDVSALIEKHIIDLKSA